MVIRSTPSLSRLRGDRVPPRPDQALGREIEKLRAELARRRRGASGGAAAWDALAPAGMRERVDVVGVRRGVLVLHARDAATRFAIDRFLRSGGEAAIVKGSKTALRGVKVIA